MSSLLIIKLLQQVILQPDVSQSRPTVASQQGGVSPSQQICRTSLANILKEEFVVLNEA